MGTDNRAWGRGGRGLGEVNGGEMGTYVIFLTMKILKKNDTINPEEEEERKNLRYLIILCYISDTQLLLYKDSVLSTNKPLAPFFKKIKITIYVYQFLAVSSTLLNI